MRFDYFPLKTGDVVVNLGANVGKATVFYSDRVGSTGKVVAIEPEKNNYNTLSHKTRDRYNVYAYRLAIGDETKKGALHVGTNRVNHSTVREFNGDTQDVDVITWDDLMIREGITETTLAKVDVEGSEIEWLRGMTHTLPKYIIMEEHSRFAYKLEELFAALREKGYVWVTEGFHVYATR